jgi:cold shock CspA family protein
MQIPLRIAFRHTASSPALETRIRERAEELERFFTRITSCHVVVECRHPRRLRRNLFQRADGSEIYFHRNSVANGGFDRLAIGDEVRFVAQERESAQGAQASTVVPLGKHRLPPVAAVRK